MNALVLEKEKDKVTTIVEKLNILLSGYMVFYQNVRGFHWNIKGNKFFELHQKFEDLYNNLSDKVDEVAERILALNSTPFHCFDDYLSASKIKTEKNIYTSEETIASVLKSFRTLLKLQREILQVAADANDEGTAALMSDYIKEQEKTLWMYNAYNS